MKSIYLVLTHTNTMTSRMIKHFCKEKYSHVSISLDPSCTEMYSFGRKYLYFTLIGCFNKENIHKGLFKIHEESTMAIYELKVTNKQYINIANKIYKISKYSKGYNILGLLLAKKRIKLNRNKYYCSEFVYEVLSSKGVNILSKNNVLFRPMELLSIDGLNLLYEGKINTYS